MSRIAKTVLREFLIIVLTAIISAATVFVVFRFLKLNFAENAAICVVIVCSTVQSMYRILRRKS